jgi:hypothetical protein
MGQIIGGLMGNSQAQNYQVDPNAFKNPVGDQSGNWQQGMQKMLGATTGAAPTAQGAQLNANQFNQSYNQEGGLANQYAQMAQGKGPSVAQVTANQQAQGGLNNTLAALGSQSGSSNPALAQRAAIDAGANAQAQAASNAVQGRTQEEMGAMGAQAGLYGNMNQQAMGMANANAQLNQQTQMANLQSALQNKQINNQQYNQYMQMLQQQNLAQFRGNQNQQQLNVQNALGQSAINVPEQEWFGNQMGQGFGQLSSGLGSLASMSDKNVKKNISKGETELDTFLSHINKIIKERK